MKQQIKEKTHISKYKQAKMFGDVLFSIVLVLMLFFILRL